MHRLRGDTARMGALLVGIVVVMSVFVPGYFRPGTFTNILDRSATDGLLAAGLVLTILAREIDLSIGATLAFTGVVFAVTQSEVGVPPAVGASLSAGLLVGLVNAFLVTRLRVLSFIATLGTLLIVRGLALSVAGGRPVAGIDLAAARFMGTELIGPVTPPVLVLITVTLLLDFFVTRTRIGREMIALGGEPSAAAAVGIPVDRRRVLAFLLCSATVAVAGVATAITLASASPIAGDRNLITAVAAVFLAGVSLDGGRGSVVATVLAVVSLSALAVGIELAGIESGYQFLITGALIIIVGIPQLAGLSRRMRATRAAPEGAAGATT